MEMRHQTPCLNCRQPLSPLATTCPSCGHPGPGQRHMRADQLVRCGGLILALLYLGTALINTPRACVGEVSVRGWVEQLSVILLPLLIAGLGIASFFNVEFWRNWLRWIVPYVLVVLGSVFLIGWGLENEGLVALDYQLGPISILAGYAFLIPGTLWILAAVLGRKHPDI